MVVDFVISLYLIVIFDVPLSATIKQKIYEGHVCFNTQKFCELSDYKNMNVKYKNAELCGKFPTK